MTTPAPDSEIVPDTKDWTWVLERPCPECGLAAGEVDPRGVIDAVPEQVTFWRTVLVHPDARRRPTPGVWSPLEYACHVRDVYDVFAARVAVALDEDAPVFPSWDQDEAAVAGAYGEQHPLAVADELTARADLMVAALARVREADWGRAAERSNGSHFTIATLVQYFLHDVVHHEHDVRHQLVDL